MPKNFDAAMAALNQARDEFSRAKLHPVAYRNARETALAQAVVAMAEELGVTLQAPIFVDANGELPIVAHNAQRTNPAIYGCGAFGKMLADALTRHGARTGVAPGTIDALNGWCRLFHVSAENMVRDYAEVRATAASR